MSIATIATTAYNIPADKLAELRRFITVYDQSAEITQFPQYVAITVNQGAPEATVTAINIALNNVIAELMIEREECVPVYLLPASR